MVKVLESIELYSFTLASPLVPLIEKVCVPIQVASATNEVTVCKPDYGSAGYEVVKNALRSGPMSEESPDGCGSFSKLPAT